MLLLVVLLLFSFSTTITSFESILGREIEVSPHAVRPSLIFQAKTKVQFLSSLFTFWNVLNGLVNRNNYGCNDKAPTSTRRSTCSQLHDRFNPYSAGHLRPIQAEAHYEYMRSMKKENIVYCEVGMNGGHSAAVALLASSSSQVHSFDMQEWKYSAIVADFLSQTFPDRFHAYNGSSFVTVPNYIKNSENPRCDVALIDGMHTYEGAMQDLTNFYNGAMACNHYLFYDDIYAGSGRALEKMISDGKIEIIEKFTFDYNSEQACLNVYYPVSEMYSRKYRKYLSWDDVNTNYKAKYQCSLLKEEGWSFAILKFKGGKYNNCRSNNQKPSNSG